MTSFYSNAELWITELGKILAVCLELLHKTKYIIPASAQKKITNAVTNTQQKVSSFRLSLLLVQPKWGDQSSSLKSTILVSTYPRHNSFNNSVTESSLNLCGIFFSCFYMHWSHIENLICGMPLGRKVSLTRQRKLVLLLLIQILNSVFLTSANLN